jgi:hypothetical protein
LLLLSSIIPLFASKYALSSQHTNCLNELYLFSLSNNTVSVTVCNHQKDAGWSKTGPVSEFALRAWEEPCRTTVRTAGLWAGIQNHGTPTATMFSIKAHIDLDLKLRPQVYDELYRSTQHGTAWPMALTSFSPFAYTSMIMMRIFHTWHGSKFFTYNIISYYDYYILVCDTN